MKLFNTKTRKLEDFKPKDPEAVSLYTCGPTVYSAPHIGNFAAYIYWDLLVRTLKANNYKVKRVLNLTDVGHLSSDADTGEDKLEKGAKKEGKTVWEIANFYIDLFKSDFKKLDLLEPELWARATDYIEEDKLAVEAMIKNGFTYELEDGVYFDTSKFPEYANFARLDLKNLKAGARVEFNEKKKNPSDFAVWKFIQPGEAHAMRWDFLGRPGYPGWHLECSTIIKKEFASLPIDIHTGGIDHIPVHHTNEIAQTFAETGSELSRFWLHCNFLKINGEKISKSRGNIITLDEIEEKGFSVFDFKTWLYQGSYHNERNFTWEDLISAKVRRLNWRNSVALLFQLPETARNKKSPKNRNFEAKILDLLNNDLNSAAAFAHIDSVASELTLDNWKFIEKLFALNLIPEDLTPRLAEKIEARLKARLKKDYKTSDKIRDELLAENISLLDAKDKTFWQFLN